VIAAGGPIAPAFLAPMMPSWSALRGLDVVDLDVRQVGGAAEMVVHELSVRNWPSSPWTSSSSRVPPVL
jgi:hypothetical protein